MHEEIELLGRGLSAAYGICVRLTTPKDVERLRQRLYKAQKLDPRFVPLAFVLPPDDTTALWIIKKEAVDATRSPTETHD